MLLPYSSSFLSPPFITYLDTQVHLTIFCTCFYYTQITLPPSNKTSQGPMLSSPNYKTHTKTSVSVMPRHPNILALAHPIHHLYQSIPSTLIPMSPNFNQMHSFFFHQAPTDTQHSLNHNKPSLCTVTYVAWRREAGRQAVHQFWVFSEFPAHEAQLVFLPLRILITRKSKYNHRPNKCQYLITMTHYYYNPISQ